MKKDKSEGYGIVSFILSILSVSFLMSIIGFFIAFILAILGVVFSVKQKRIHPNGLNTAGFVISIIVLCISGLILLSGIIWWALLP